MTWHQDPQPYGKTPTLVLVGSEDKETPDIARAFLQQYVAATPGSRYLEIAGAAHDVISLHEPRTEQGIEAYGAVYTFLHRLLESRRDAHQ
jgi:hypothetical protein